MKPEKLSKQELEETNGGSLVGGNDSSSMSDLGASLGIDNLASFSNESGDDDSYNKNSGSIGNGIGADTRKMGNQSND